MSEAATFAPAAGLASLLSALRPRIEPEFAPPPPDLDAIRAEGWETGFSAGEAAAHASLAPLRMQLAEAAAALDAACRIDADALRPLFVALVTGVAEAVLHAEMRGGGAVLEPLVAAALALVRPGERPVLHAHPETLAALRPHLPEIAVVGDAELALDAFSVRAPDFIIETGLSARLRDVAAALA